MIIDKLKIITSNFDIPSDRIDLSIGQPGTSLLPLAALAQAAEHCLTRDNSYILAYGAEQGNWYFHDVLAGFLSEHYKFSVDPDHLFTTAGISQGLDFLCKLFTQPGDTVFVEKPTYSLALGIFADHRLNVVGLPMDEDGVIIEAIEEELAHQTPVAIGVESGSAVQETAVVPDHQISRLPVMGVHVLFSGGPLEQIIEQRPALDGVESDDLPGM